MPKSLRKIPSSALEINKNLRREQMRIVYKKRNLRKILKKYCTNNETLELQKKDLEDQVLISKLVSASIGSMFSAIATVVFLHSNTVTFSEDKEINTSIIYKLTAAGFVLGGYLGTLFANKLSPSVAYQRMMDVEKTTASRLSS